MGSWRHLRRALLAGAFVLAGAGLAGCGGIAFEGKLLDQVGLSTKALSARKKESKLNARSGLVVPPSVEALPVPGTGGADVAATDPSFPVNPETLQAEARRKQAEELKRKCEESNKKFGPRQGGRQGAVDGLTDEKYNDCTSPAKEAVGNAL